jgi:HK97 gp10 family phage protein
MIKFSFQGLDSLKAKIDNAITQTENTMDNLVTKEANFIKTNSYSEAPRRTGALKNSQTFVPKKTSKGNLSYEIGFTAKYAPYWDFGTRPNVDLTGDYSEFTKFASNYGPKAKPPRSPVHKRFFLKYFVLSKRELSRQTSSFFKNLFK